MSAAVLRLASEPIPRPDSIATDFDDLEGDESDFEEYVYKHSFDSDDSRRRSQTTLSSYDEAITPDASRGRRPFEMRFKPVEGPKGPHLFRSSQSSADFAWDHALQMSPLQPAHFFSTFPNEVAAPGDVNKRKSPINTADALAIVRSWSSAEVLDWMRAWDLDPSTILCFERHDITGALLLELQFEDLRDLDIESFGKRHQLWTAISILRGDDEEEDEDNDSPNGEFVRPRSRSRRRNLSRSRSLGHAESELTARSPATERTAVRRGRKSPKQNDTITPGESVSIVAIEQLLPKPHKCSRGENCPKWRKQQRQIQQLRDENAIGTFPVSPTKGGRIFIAGDPGNATVAENLVPNVTMRRAQTAPAQIPSSPSQRDTVRPTSEAVPSVVASSDLLGPGLLPEFVLEPETLDRLDKRDPQDNVRHFLKFQHMNSPTVPASPPAELADPWSIPRSQSVPAVPAMFPAQYHEPYGSSSVARPNVPPPDARVQALPRLQIPRTGSAGSHAKTSGDTCNSTGGSPVVTAICRSATTSPSQQIYRLGTPASEMDVPVTAVPAGPISREASQSVPPNMQYRQPHRSSSQRHGAGDWRRPSLPAVREGEVLTSPEPKQQPSRPVRQSSDSSNSCGLSSTRSSEDKPASIRDPSHHDSVIQRFGYGADCTHAGFMKKRRTKMLRHEWQESHFRLMGTKLNMHDSARLSAALKATIDVDDYAVACSTAGSNSKLTAAMRAFHLRSSSNAADRTEADPAAFAFQLVPTKEAATRAKSGSTSGAGSNGSSKTHHFAVRTKDDRIDWMRELMLAKALQQKGKGYEVEVNGVQA